MSQQFATLNNERELFALAATGDETAFASIFHHYNKQLYPFVLKMTKNESAAEEIVQEVVTVLWLKRQRLAEVDNCASYIFRIATNKTLNHLKKIASEGKMLKQVLLSIRQSKNLTEELIDSKEKEAIINSAISQLPPQRKIIYKLSRQDGLSHQEIAEQLNISPNTVKNQLVEALKFIRGHIQKTASVVILLAILREYFD